MKSLLLALLLSACGGTWHQDTEGSDLYYVLSIVNNNFNQASVYSLSPNVRWGSVGGLSRGQLRIPKVAFHSGALTLGIHVLSGDTYVVEPVIIRSDDKCFDLVIDPAPVRTNVAPCPTR